MYTPDSEMEIVAAGSTKQSKIGDLIEPILRGAAKIIGSSTATLILINERTRTARLRIGVQGEGTPMREVETIFASPVSGLSVAFETAEDSLVFEVWRNGTVVETSSVVELAGGALPAEVLQQLEQLIGAHRFLCVPVVSRSRKFGAIIFEREGGQPFSRQQRDLGVRYASRIGEIVENDLWAEGEEVLSASHEGPRPEESLFLLLDEAGAMLSRTGSGSAARARGTEGDGLPTEVLAELRERATALLQGDGAVRSGAPIEVSLPGVGGLGHRRLWAELARLSIEGRDRVLCRLWEPRRTKESSLENVLLQFAVGEPAPSLFLDRAFRVTSCNRAAEALFGRTAQELRGTAVRTLFHGSQDMLRLLDHRVLAMTNGYGEEMAAVRRHDGVVVPARVEAVLLAEPGDRLAGYLVLIRTRSEADASADGLMRRERLATMGEMAAALAHELRNPLVAIGATLEGLGEELADRPETARVLADVSREIVRLDMLLKDYLSLAARQDAHLARVDLGRVLEESCELLRRTGKLGARALEVDLAPGAEVLADSDGLRHVFFNLLHNAVEATGNGGRIVCHGQLGERDATVWIDDDGPGLAVPAEQCLEPFFTTKENGSGLGLAVCHRIVHAHGGTIYLQNREEGGCRAAVVLPRGAR
ncbi:MAG: PAS domain-containing protein [Deltaproteobacteria bacterium]|nr:PAS domain-containing protein [Deltaproteobacteria bacterium]